MATLTLDTYQFIDKLRSSGMAEPQAKAIAEGIRDIDFNHVATKQDVKFAIDELKIDLLKWVIPLLLGQAGFFAVLTKLM